MSKPRIEVKPIEQAATPDLGNVNKHTQRGGALLENELRKRGAFRSIASAGKDTDTPVVYAGNYTLEKAVDAGFTEIVNVYVDGSQLVNVVRTDLAPGTAEAIALGISDNEIGKQSYSPDIDVLAALAAGDNAILSALRAEDKIFGSMLEGMGLKEEGADAEPQIDRAAELLEKWKVKTGDMFAIGEHRLICGDCTDAVVVERVMGGERAGMMVTDPPYGVEYDPAWRDGVVGEFGAGAREKNAVANDDIVDWTPAWDLFEGDVAYVWHASLHTSEVFSSLLASRFEIRSNIIWAKQHFAISQGHYHWKHEPCWYAVRKGKTSKWIGDRTQTTIWEISSLNPAGRQEERLAHGTQKPLECMERPIRNHDFEVVYDPFGGSGTTMVACNNLGRQCRMIEIDPKYCAVILERMSILGLSPVLVKEPAGVNVRANMARTAERN